MENKHIQAQQVSELGKMPPQSIEIEETILGALLLESDNHDKVIPFLPEGAFYREKNAVIFSAIKTLYEKNQTADIITVSNQLKSTGKLEVSGGTFYLSTLGDKIGSSSNIEEHMMILKEKWMAREVIRVSSESIKLAYDDTADIFDTLVQNKTGFDAIDQSIVQHRQASAFSSLVDEAAVEMKNRFEQQKSGIVSGVPSPVRKLDAHTGGWQPGDLIVLAARPGMGKTAFALSCSKFAAQKGFHPCIFSLEMSSVSLVNRIILSETNITPWNYRNGKLDQNDWDDFNDASSRIKSLPIHIFDAPSVNMNFIKAQMRIMKRKGRCDFIIIDYLQLIQASNNRVSREQQVSEMSRDAKLLARELSVPVMLLSQLSREVEKRGGDKKPILSDLRDSGAIEQDADMVIFPHRPEYYGIRDSSGVDLTGVGEFLIAKGRNTGTAEIAFRHNDAITNFYDFDAEPLQSAMKPSSEFFNNNGHDRY